MRIVLMFEAFSKNMGYLGNMLPKYLARLGADVHVVTTDLPFYYSLPDFKQTYDTFIQSNSLSPGSVEKYDGYTLHILPHKKVLGYVQMIGWFEKLKEIKPDIVQALPAIGWIPLNAALAKPILKYKLFTGSHTTASVFPLAYTKASFFSKEILINSIIRGIPGRLISLFTEKCYAATIDCADVAERFFGVQKSKIDICHLGVDTDIFKPLTSEIQKVTRQEIRHQLGFQDQEIVCIYTGRFSKEKNPVILAKAIDELNKIGENFRGLFIGNGNQLDEILSCSGCVVHPFVHVNKLGDFFRASDIGVWPTQESTSMIDAAACGLPIVVNNTLLAVERIEGNGLTYKLNNVEDLVTVLQSLSDFEKRKQLGNIGAVKMQQSYSWYSLAQKRLEDYQQALSK